jgi:hypothetical protein
MTDEKEAPIGYRRPPRHTQFKPGESGNPKGRSKQSANRAGAIIVSLPGAQLQPMSTFECDLRKLVQRALNNDWRAVEKLLHLCQKHKVIKPAMPQ